MTRLILTLTLLAVSFGLFGQQPMLLAIDSQQQVDSLILDKYPGASAAYSLRKLDMDYTGYAARIRRASDDSLKNIGFSGEHFDQANAESFCAATDCFLERYYNQAGGVPATQTVDTLQAKIVSNGSLIFENGRAAVEYDSTKINYYVADSIISASELFYVHHQKSENNTADGVMAVSDWVTGEQDYLIGASKDQSDTFIDTGVGNPSYRVNGAAITRNWKAMHDASDRKQCVITVTGMSMSDQVVLYGFTTSNNWEMEGTSQEFIFYETDQSGNLQEIEDLIDTYYSIY